MCEVVLWSCVVLRNCIHRPCFLLSVSARTVPGVRIRRVVMYAGISRLHVSFIKVTQTSVNENHRNSRLVFVNEILFHVAFRQF